MDLTTLNTLRDNPKDLIVLASWFYKCGEPIIDDFEYNALAKSFGDLDIVWDELDEPVELLNKYNIPRNTVTYKEIGQNKYFEKYMDSLYEAGTKSIRPEYDKYDIYDRFVRLKSITDEVVISLKVDGVSTRNILEEENGKWNLVASLSRSRESRGFDYTDGMQLSVKRDLTFPEGTGSIHEGSGKRVLFSFGEAYVERSSLEYLREKYNKQNTWKTPRSTALSMLRDTIYPEDYKYLKYKCFRLDVGCKLSEMYELIKSAGLDTVPYEVIKTEDIPTVNYRIWEMWFDDILVKYRNIQNEQDIEADGIVVAINDQARFNSLGTSTDGKYNNGTFSCKVGPWGSQLYESKVVKIHFDNTGNTSEFSVVAEVEPVKVETGNVVTRVNCFNPKILIDNKINIGSYIKFEYKSASSIVLVYR